jgi:hypothetical protein
VAPYISPKYQLKSGWTVGDLPSLDLYWDFTATFKSIVVKRNGQIFRHSMIYQYQIEFNKTYRLTCKIVNIPSTLKKQILLESDKRNKYFNSVLLLPITCFWSTSVLLGIFWIRLFISYYTVSRKEVFCVSLVHFESDDRNAKNITKLKNWIENLRVSQYGFGSFLIISVVLRGSLSYVLWKSHEKC